MKLLFQDQEALFDGVLTITSHECHMSLSSGQIQRLVELQERTDALNLASASFQSPEKRLPYTGRQAFHPLAFLLTYSSSLDTYQTNDDVIIGCINNWSQILEQQGVSAAFSTNFARDHIEWQWICYLAAAIFHVLTLPR